MRYLSIEQVEQKFEELTVEKQLETYKKAFTLKSMGVVDDRLTRIDCLAMAMGLEKCISGSGFYEHVDWKDVLYDEMSDKDKDNFKL